MPSLPVLNDELVMGILYNNEKPEDYVADEEGVLECKMAMLPNDDGECGLCIVASGKAVEVTLVNSGGRSSPLLVLHRTPW